MSSSAPGRRCCARSAVAIVNAAGASAQSSFSAHGSAEQVYVTGLAPRRADVAAQRQRRQTLYTQNADSLGGLLFRNVPPGNGLPRAPRRRTARSRRRSRCTPTRPRRGTRRLQPVDPRQRLRRTSRRATARSSRSTCTRRRSPAGEPGLPPRARHASDRSARLHAAVPDADRVLGLRLRQPGRARTTASRCSRT